jgi:tol-pal system protein YbgF
LRIRWIALTIAALLLGAFAGSLLTPSPASGVSKEMIQLQQSVDQLQQGQQSLRSALDASTATQQTLIKQALDAVNQLNTQMGALQQTVQQVQANTGSRLDSMTTQTQGVSDNMADMQARVAKLAQQINDMQSLLQSIDAKVSGNAPPASATPGGSSSAAPAPGSASGGPSGAGLPPISADTLYQNALRDFTSGNYDLSRQEFSDYIKDFPSNDLAGNAQFYLGEISYAQNNFKGAIAAYNVVLQNYPQSFKLGASLLKRAYAELELGQKSAAIRDFREVERRFPGSDEARRAQAKLHELGATSSRSATH